MKKRILSFILTLVMMLTMLPVLETEAKAAYENTHINTGDYRTDIIAVAKTQLGYTEGKNNDTKYGTWYGAPNQSWCATFVSWCARQAGIPTDILRNSANAAPNASVYSFNGDSKPHFNIPYYNGDSYTPKSGDLFFTKSFSHVGLVSSVDGSYFYTIEGNSNTNGSNNGTSVVSLKRTISEYYFGVPAYSQPTQFYIEAYPLSYGNISVYNAPNGEKLSNRYITGSTDLCKILETSDKWFYVSYPSSAEADGWFEAWVPVSEFTPLQSGKKWITEKSYTMYRRSDKKEVFDTIPAGFEVLETCIDGNMVQVAYQPGNYKRMGWIEVHTHNYSKTVKEPTCFEQGYTTYTCSCGDSYNADYTDATGHDPIIIKGKDATCTFEGYTDCEKCSKCGYIISDHKVIEPTGHKWDDGKVTKEATCEIDGVILFTCNNDSSHTKTEAIKAHGHSSVTIEGKAATCTEAGLTDGAKCSKCGKILTEQKEIPAVGHKWDSGKITKDATCEIDGVKKFTCQNDSSHTKTESIKATGHSSVTIKGKAATCTEAGLTDGAKCSKCGKILTEQKEIPATGHKTELKNKKSATCTSDGYTGDEICKTCSKTVKRGEVIKATGHKWDTGKITKEATCESNGEKKFTCRNDSSHTKVESVPAIGHKDSDSDFICDVCSKILCTDHSSVTIKGKTATCTEAGLTDGAKCSKCGKILTEQKEIPAAGHTEVIDKAVAATCAKSGLSEGKHCSVCNTVLVQQEKIPTKAHSYSAGKCVVCGASDPNYVPPTTKPTSGFTDIKTSDWFYTAVLWAVDKGITGGTSANTFSPNNPCTREQVVTFLWAAAGKPEPKSTFNPFTDVKMNDWFYKPVLWAVENGITGGVSATQFGTGQTCTRAQVAVFLYAFKGKPGFTAAQNPFSDMSKGDWFYNAVMWAVENDITGGIGGGKFGPNDFCTRGQIALFLYKADPIEGVPVKPDVPTDLVTDAYVDTLKLGNSTLCYHIPKINLDGNVAQELNRKIYDAHYDMLSSRPFLRNISYIWGQKGACASIVVREYCVEESSDIYNRSYFVYNFSTETGKKCTDNEIFAACNTSEDQFYDLVRSGLSNYIDNWDLSDHDNPEKLKQYLKTANLEEKNVKTAFPFIGKDGTLCFVVNLVPLAGGQVYLLFDGTNTITWPECSIH